MLRCCVLVLLGLLAAPALGAEALRPPPWHLVDIWWDTGEDRRFESYSIAVEIREEVPADVRLYVAPIGIATLSGTKFYGGIQTMADGYSKQNRRLRPIGRGLLMSMWGERSEEAIRPSVGGLFQSSGHEGDFVSVRRPYAWTKGTYTYRVVRMDEEVVNGQPHTWVGAFLYSHANDENVFIGALRFSGKDLVLGRSLASFVEIYGPRIPVDRIPSVTVTFGDLRLGGQPVAPDSATAVYPKDVPDYAEASATEGRIRVVVGRQVDRTQRRVRLLPAP